MDIGDSFEDDYYVLEKESFNPEYFFSSPEAWSTFINSFANLLMIYKKDTLRIYDGIARKYILGTEFIDQRAYLRIDFKYMLFFPETLYRQLERDEQPEIGGKYYTPNRSVATLKQYRKVSVEEYEKLMKEMLPRSSEITKDRWEKGMEKAKQRGYGYIAIVVFGEDEGREYTYPANALVKVRCIEDLDREELKQIRPTPEQRWKLITRFRDRVASLLKGYSIALDVKPYTKIEYIAPSFEVVDGGGKIYQINWSVRKVLETQNWKPIIRNPRISVGFLYLYTDRNSFRGLENRARIIENTVLKKVSSLGLHIDRLKPIPIPIPTDVKEFSLLPHVGDLEGSNAFLFVLTNASKLDTEFYTEIKRELLERGVQSQVIYHRTKVGDKHVVHNLTLGLLGKTGNYPYFLKESSNKVFVGIDLSRKARSSSKGTVNAVGTAIIVDAADGGTITYRNINVPAGGEAIEEAYVQKLGSILYDYRDRFIVLHRDGRVSEDELKAYVDIFSKKYRIENFALVSILKSGTPRIFQMKGNVVGNPSKGCAILLSKQEAVISTYEPSLGTHIPLRIKVLYGDYPLNEAIEDVLRLTLLNFSSFTLNKLPATVAFADRIAWYNLHGVGPEDTDGNLFFL
ncbi:Piwi domain-containing protein [Thermocrinis sp.]|uniref:Piwi domain-containing protein n=1 Tax=Thermocrinis sp. TaxID=2024383 RepID=UPI003C75BBC3